MSKEKKSIPELRFPEFKNDGEWDNKTLDETGKIVTGKTPSTKDASLWDGEILFITPTDIEEKKKYQTETKRTVIRNEKLDVLPEGSIAYTCIASIGKIAITAKESVTNQQINSIVVNYHNEFIYYSLIHLTPYIKSRPATSTLPIINKTEFSGFRINVPQPQEQQKIASCLSSLDELIAAHNDKLDALKDHKKGLMQNLFPQEGETVPKVRFPEFEGDGEWMEKELSEVAQIITGSTPSTKVPEYYGGEIMFVSPVDISDNKYVEFTEKTLSQEGFEKTRKIKAHSVMFVCIGSTIGKVAMNKYDCATNQQINSLVPNNNYLSDFLYSNLELNAAKIAEIAGNQAVPIINKTLFSSVKLKFPPKEREQQKIASCLSAVDELITVQAEKIEQLQEHKKGLMQGLFPKIEN